MMRTNPIDRRLAAMLGICAALIVPGACNERGSDDGSETKADSGIDTAVGDSGDTAGAEEDTGSEDTASSDATDRDLSPEGDTSSTDTADADGGVTTASCGELPIPGGPTTTVAGGDTSGLEQALRNASKNETILLENGTFDVGSRIDIATEGVTLRSKSGDPSQVLLAGGYNAGEILNISASNVTVAHVSIENAENHAIHIVPPSGGPDVTGVRLYDLRLIDHGEQFVKVNSPASNDAWVDDGRLECSHLEMTSAGRPHIENQATKCYTGGIDAHGARGWLVRDNTFRGIYCTNGGIAEHAVHFWNTSRGTTVERNRILNCARGIGLGLQRNASSTRSYSDNPYPGAGFLDHIDGEVHNNFVYANVPWMDTGISMAQARGTEVHHNTVFVTGGAMQRFFSSIDYRFSNTRVTVTNNLVQKISRRNGAMGTVRDNERDATASMFVDPSNGDLHLSSGASPIDSATSVPGVTSDIDGDPRPSGNGPDIGADEYRP